MNETPIDVDATWDGTGSLDDHRQKEFAKIEQPGFGGKPQPQKPETKPVKPEVKNDGK